MADFFTKNLSFDEFKTLLIKKSTTDNHNANHLLENFNIKNFEFPEKTIKNINFKTITWEKIDANGRTFSNIQFEDCTLINLNFRNMVFENVSFKNCTLKNVVMNQSTIDTMTFIDTKIFSTDSNIENRATDLNADHLIFINAEIKNMSYFHSKANFVFKNSKLNDVAGRGLKPGSSIKIQQSDIFFMEFSASHLSSLIIKKSKVEESRINDATIKSIVLEDNDFDNFPITGTDGCDSVIADNNTEVTVNGDIKNIHISNCRGYEEVYVADTFFDNISIDNCKLPDLTAFDAKGKKMTFSNIETYRLDLEAIDIEHLILKNVNIEGKIYAKKAQVKIYEAHNVTVSPNVKRITEGANFIIENTP